MDNSKEQNNKKPLFNFSFPSLDIGQKRNILFSSLSLFIVLVGLITTVSMTQKRETQSVLAGTSDFETMKIKWRDYLTGGSKQDLSDPVVQKRISDITNTAQKNWNEMKKGSNPSYLWSDIKHPRKGFNITEAYRRLYSMTLAFSTKGSSLYGKSALYSDIVDGLAWVHKNWYNENVKEPVGATWFAYEIGSPLILNDITLLLSDELPKSKITKYMDTVKHFDPENVSPGTKRGKTGANRAWVSRVRAIRGVVLKSSSAVSASRSYTIPLFKYVKVGDGIYADGSFIHHYDPDAKAGFGYNGGYGKAFFDSLTELAYLYSGTKYDYSTANKNVLYDWYKDSFATTNYKGELMDMVDGRSISRWRSGMGVSGSNAYVDSLLLLSNIYSTSSSMYKTLNKELLNRLGGKAYSGSLINITWSKDVINQQQVQSGSGYVPVVLNKVFGVMDRIVHFRPNFAVGISMSSSRVFNYESISDENIKGWYTGDGMLYVYNDDLSAFGDAFWATVNPHRLPGTTVDTMDRAKSSGAGTKSGNSWAGGVTLNNIYGVGGMQLNGWNTSLVANKSWFMFDKEVVALGSGISASSGRDIETIVENRKIKNDNSNAFTVDGNIKPRNLDWSYSGSIKWANLEGVGGYYFPSATKINILRDSRSGKWTDINTKVRPPDGNPTYTRNFITMWINHGRNPDNETYSYVLLPNMSVDDTASYSANPEIQILNNNNKLQAVRQKTLRIIGANFFQPESVSYIKALQKSSVMTKEDPGFLTVSVSDPSQTQSKINIQIDLNKTPFMDKSKVKTLVSSSHIKVSKSGSTLKLVIDVKGARGKSYQVVLGDGTVAPTPMPNPAPIPFSFSADESIPVPFVTPFPIGPTPTPVASSSPTITPTDEPVQTTDSVEDPDDVFYPDDDDLSGFPF